MTAQAGQNVQIDEKDVKEGAPKFEAPITPLMRIDDKEERKEDKKEEAREQTILPSEKEFAALMKMAEMLAGSGFLPRKLDTPGKVLAVILTGREMGFAPMLSTRAIRIQEKTGYPIVLADALLGNFKSRGGRAIFRELTDTRAVLWLRHPNGDEHTETFTVEIARNAGLFKRGERNEPSNWEKYPKAMLRSRAITAGLKSVGWEPAAAAYSPDEAEEIAAVAGLPTTITATVTPSGEVRAEDTSDRPIEAPAPVPSLRGHRIDEKQPNNPKLYFWSEMGLQKNHDWALDMATKASDEKRPKDAKRFTGLADAIVRELKRRQAEIEQALGEEVAEEEAADFAGAPEGDHDDDDARAGDYAERDLDSSAGGYGA